MTCLAFGAGLISIYGFFVEPLSREFGVGVATLNLGPVALLLVPGIVAPRVGRLVDRMSIRRLILIGATFAMVSLAAVSQAPSLRVAALAFLCFALGLTLYGPVVINGLMVKTFPGREARALAVAAMGISFATALLPPVVGALLAHMDWRGALLSVASALLLLLWLAVLVGIPGRASGLAAAGQHRLASGIYSQKVFWLIGLCVALGFNVSIVMAICYPPLFISEGYSVAEAGWFISMTGMAGLTGKAGIAWLGDAGRNHARWLAAGLLLLQATGACLLLTAGDSAGVLAALCLLGLGGGAFIPMHPYLNSRYYDAENIGQVNGAQMPLFLPFGLIGAPLAGYAYDQSGNYDAVLVAIAVTLGVAALLALALPAPE